MASVAVTCVLVIELCSMSDRSTSLNVTAPEVVWVAVFSPNAWSAISVIGAACVEDVMVGTSLVPVIVTVNSAVATPPRPSSTMAGYVRTRISPNARKSKFLSARL